MDQKKNQGFSLVELIVVIAIMAVLVGVLAPAYLKYVEKSRKSSDISSISDILSAAEKVAVDVQFNCAKGDKFTCSIVSGTATLSVTAGTGSTTAVANVAKEWRSIALSSTSETASYKCKSSDFKSQTVTIYGTVQADGSVTWTHTAVNGADTGAATIITYSTDFETKFFGSTNSTNVNE